MTFADGFRDADRVFAHDVAEFGGTVTLWDGSVYVRDVAYPMVRDADGCLNGDGVPVLTAEYPLCRHCALKLYTDDVVTYDLFTGGPGGFFWSGNTPYPPLVGFTADPDGYGEWVAGFRARMGEHLSFV